MKFLLNLSKPVRWFLLPFITLLFLLLLLISPLLEYVIEKNSKEWVGRQIMMDDLSLNLLTGHLELEGLKFFEKDDRTVFVSAGLIDVNAEMLKIITGNYAIASLRIDSIYINLAHDNNGWLYEDLIPAEDTVETAVPAEPLKYEVFDISITNGLFAMDNLAFSNRTEFHDLNISCPGIKWNQDLVETSISFGLGSAGKVTTDADYNMKTAVYNAHTVISKLDLKPIKPYFQDIMDIDDFGCLLSCDLLLKGNGDQPTDIALTGNIGTSDFYMTGPRKDTLVYVREFSLSVDTINLKNNIIDLETIRLIGSYSKFELFDNGLNNFTALMAADTVADPDSSSSEMQASNPFTLIAEYAKAMRDEYDIDSYSIDSILVDEGRVVFNDYTLHETFSYDISQIKIWSNNFNSTNKRVEIETSALLNGHGHAEALYAFDPADMMEMDLFYRITDMHVSDISPYSVFYVAHPFWEGDVTMESTTSVKSKHLNSNNKLLIEKIKVGSKANKPALYDMPLKLAIAILKDPKGNINLELPAEGDLNDPEYKFGKMIWGIIKNLLIKATTAPYKLLAGMFGTNEENLRQLSFDYMQSELDQNQLDQVSPIVKILENKQELIVTLRQLTDPSVEDEKVASLNARRMFWHSRNGGSMTDTLTSEQLASVESLHIKDSAFTVWVDSILGPTTTLIPMQEKVIYICGRENVSAVEQKLRESRNRSLQQHFINLGADTSRIRIYTEDPRAVPIQETRSKYLIEFGVE